MAERRMFAKTIIDSDAFLDMPLTTQALYFHLSMRADDDGFVNNPKKIQRMVGASDDDAKLLFAKQFIIPFESGVVVIRHWKIHNYIRNDRYSPSVCTEEKAQLTLTSSGIYEMEPVGRDCGIPSDNQSVYQRYTTGIPTDIPMVDTGKDSIGKDRLELGKNRVGKDRDRGDSPASPPAPKEVRHQYGEYKNVLLTDADLEKLKVELPDTYQDYIERLSRYMASKGVSYKSHLATIRNWARKDAEQRQPQQPQKEERTYQYGIYL